MWSCPVMGDDIDYNIGIALDINTLVVDVDVRNGKQGAKSLALLEAIYDDLPATYTVTTASGGEHRYFTVDDSGVFAKTLATDIDLKGEGGYVVGPGSTIDGRSYQVVRGGGLCRTENSEDESERQNAVPYRADGPAWLLQHAGAGTRTRNARLGEATCVAVNELDTAPAVARATDYLLNHAPEAIEGAGGDNVTIQVANRVGDFGVSLAKAKDLMHDWNDAKASPPWDADELEAKVASAFRSRQNPIGVASPEAEFEPVEVDKDAPAPKRRGLHVVRWSDAKPTLDRPYLIDDVIDAGAMVVTYGDSNAGKTYVVLDQCFHIASGKDWNGHKVQQGLVVYVAAEGGAGFFKRVEAFKRHYKVTELPFSLVPCPIDLQSDNADTRKLVKLIREEEAHFGQKCVLVVIDTLARAMGGGDENTSVDMGKFVGHSDALRAATGAAVNVIHHTGKDKAKGARGSSALRAATDTEIEIRPGELEVMKQRDMAPSPALHFKLEAIEIGSRSDGRPVTACVVQWVSESEFETRVSPAALEVLGVLEELVAAEQDRIEEETGSDETNKSDIRIEWHLWQMSCLSVAKGPRGKKLNRTVLYRLRAELSQNGLVGKDSKNQWFIQ